VCQNDAPNLSILNQHLTPRETASNLAPSCPSGTFGKGKLLGLSSPLNLITKFNKSGGKLYSILRTQNGIVEFIIKVGKNHEISHILKSLLIDSGLLSRHVVARREGDRYRANLKLPREGEYVINSPEMEDMVLSGQYNLSCMCTIKKNYLFLKSRIHTHQTDIFHKTEVLL
jgi:hypothetical protein